MTSAHLRGHDGIARYVVVEAAYEADATRHQRSLRPLIPELGDAGLTMLRDSPGLRTWAGVVDGGTYARVADAWALDRRPNIDLLMVTEYGELTCHAYTWDGMEWERDGSSPVAWVRLGVSDGIRAAASGGRRSGGAHDA